MIWWIDTDGNLCETDTLNGYGEIHRIPPNDALPILRARRDQLQARQDELVNQYPALKSRGAGGGIGR